MRIVEHDFELLKRKLLWTWCRISANKQTDKKTFTAKDTNRNRGTKWNLGGTYLAGKTGWQSDA